MEITMKIEITINLKNVAICGGCKFLSQDGGPTCRLYNEWLTWDYLRCTRCLKDFGDGVQEGE